MVYLFQIIVSVSNCGPSVSNCGLSVSNCGISVSNRRLAVLKIYIFTYFYTETQGWKDKNFIFDFLKIIIFELNLTFHVPRA